MVQAVRKASIRMLSSDVPSYVGNEKGNASELHVDIIQRFPNVLVLRLTW